MTLKTKKLSGIKLASQLTGDESFYVIQGGKSRRSITSAIVTLVLLTLQQKFDEILELINGTEFDPDIDRTINGKYKFIIDEGKSFQVVDGDVLPKLHQGIYNRAEDSSFGADAIGAKNYYTDGDNVSGFSWYFVTNPSSISYTAAGSMLSSGNANGSAMVSVAVEPDGSSFVQLDGDVVNLNSGSTMVLGKDAESSLEAVTLQQLQQVGTNIVSVTEPSIPAGTLSQFLRGDKTFHPIMLDASAIMSGKLSSDRLPNTIKNFTNTVYTAGDSLTKAGWISAGNTYYNLANESPFNWFNAFLGAPFNYLGNTSSGGKTCRQMIDEQFPTIVSASPNYCWFTAGHNDIFSEGVTSEECYNRIIEAVTKLINAGITPIWSTIWCRSYDSIGTPKMIKVNDKLRRYAYSNECGMFWDGAAITNDPASLNYEGRLPLASYYYDAAIHPNNLLGLYIGKFAAAQLSERIVKANFSTIGNENVTFSGGANLLLNPSFIGTSSASATGVTGVVPTGWTIAWATRNGNGTAYCELVGITDPVTGLQIANGIQITISGTCSANDIVRVRQTDTENSGLRTNLSADSVIQAEVTMSLASSVNVSKLYCRAQTNTNEATFAGLNTQTPVAYPSSVSAHTLRTRQMTVLGSGEVDQALFEAVVGFNGAGTGTVITIWHPRFRKVS